ncbi:MAG: ATP-binding cassette domain-containing protein [Clostridia bacterium]|nr:ATP-binding cassette domain-containing protein [Clostridia bacterium]
MSIVKIEHLFKTFNTKNGSINALNDINLEIEQGDIFGIIGLSGAGKSTLVRCINFLEKPTKGSVFFEGKDLGKLNKKELLKARQSIGMIFQNFNLLEQRNSLKNICFPLEIAGVPKQKAEQRARELLKTVGLEDREKSYPSQLSGGQKQRVAIARALATNPKILLCDEATSALDPTTTQSILSLLKEINAKMNVTIIIITHEMNVIEKICNKVAVIDNSQIVETGYVKDVYSNPRSDMAKKLIIPRESIVRTLKTGSYFRIVFDSHTTHRPILSELVLECKYPINLIYADSIEMLNENAVGEMVIEKTGIIETDNKIKDYLKRNNIKYEEANK